MVKLYKKNLLKGLVSVSLTLNFALGVSFVKHTMIDDRDVIEYHFHASIVTEGGDSLTVSMAGDSIMVIDTNSGKEWVIWWPMPRTAR